MSRAAPAAPTAPDAGATSTAPGRAAAHRPSRSGARFACAERGGSETGGVTPSRLVREVVLDDLPVSLRHAVGVGSGRADVALRDRAGSGCRAGARAGAGRR